MDITSYLMGKKQGGGGSTINNQDKTVNINGVYTADSGYTGLGTVTVSVPAPSGEISITENGTYDVTNKASAVVNVPSGTPTTLSELQTVANTFENNYLKTIPSNRDTYTNNSVTLYSPNSNLLNYVIVEKTTGYIVAWSTGLFQRQMFSTNPNDCVVYCRILADQSSKTSSKIFGTKINDYNTYYYSEPISTIDELIEKMQTENGLTYTRKQGNTNYISYVGGLSSGVYYSNGQIINGDYNIDTVGIISYNETIVTQS